MLAKHFKELLKNIPDNMLVLFDDGAGVFQPLSSSIEMKVVTFDEPGDPSPEFFDANDWKSELEDYTEAQEEFGMPDQFDALVFSVDPAIGSVEGPES